MLLRLLLFSASSLEVLVVKTTITCCSRQLVPPFSSSTIIIALQPLHQFSATNGIVVYESVWYLALAMADIDR